LKKLKDKPAATLSQSKAIADMPRHRQIYEVLLAEIQTGVYKPGDRLPSEALLCERFDASRITVAKAFQSLQRDNLVRRRPGSGTYVEKVAQDTSLQFGVLIPDFGSTDIFEPICKGIMHSPAAGSHSLTWGSSAAGTSSKFQAAELLCQQYINQGVAGVFFAPTECSDDAYESNHRLIAMLERAKIPVVLLDRDIEHYPDRSNFDLVGIDNHRAGFVLTRHLIQAGAKRIVFAMRKNSASTVEARAAGYREALFTLQNGAKCMIFTTDFERPEQIKKMLDSEKPDGIVCANDVTAAHLMRTLVSLGVRIPAEIRMVGLDDVNYAQFLPTPLTTLRQNCLEIGAVAMSTMLERLSVPNHPVRACLVRCELIVRASCGTLAASQVSI
jgi:GntR family transcriptional regulator of arabinose operon